MLLTITLLQVAAEVAAPLSQAKKITMVSSGTGEVGAAKLTGEVLSIVATVPELVRKMTGVDIAKVTASAAILPPRVPAPSPAPSPNPAPGHNHTPAHTSHATSHSTHGTPPPVSLRMLSSISGKEREAAPRSRN